MQLGLVRNGWLANLRRHATAPVIGSDRVARSRPGCACATPRSFRLPDRTRRHTGQPRCGRTGLVARLREGAGIKPTLDRWTVDLQVQRAWPRLGGA